MSTPTPELEAQWREEAKKVWTEQGRAHWVNMSDFDSFAAGYIRARTEQAAEIASLKASRSITLVNDREPDVKPALSLIEQPLITAEEARKLGPGNAMYLLINTWIPCTGVLYNTHYFGGEKIKYRAIKPDPAEQAIKDAREQVMEEVIQCVNSERGSSTDNLILALREL